MRLNESTCGPNETPPECIVGTLWKKKMWLKCGLSDYFFFPLVFIKLTDKPFGLHLLLPAFTGMLSTKTKSEILTVK